MRFLIHLPLLCLLPLVGWAQSSLPPCPTGPKAYRHNCFGSLTFTDGASYVGEFKAGDYNGQGIYTFSDGRKYVGEFKDGNYNGQGTYTFSDGRKYVGEFKDDRPNGQGIEYRPDGSVLRSGQWTHGNLTQSYALDGARFPFSPAQEQADIGAITFPDGAKYVGELRRGVRHGEGIYYSSSGVALRQGRWEDDLLVQSFAVDTNRFPFNPQAPATASAVGWAQSSLPQCPSDVKAYWHNCFGTYTFANGDKYVGEFKDNKYNGQGTFTYANGYKYVGEFKDDLPNGQGTFTYANGDKYVGEFKDDKYNGQGTYTFANGNKHVGEYKDNNRNGQGTFTFANGAKYVGEYKDDLPNGQGIEYRADGSVGRSGLWTNGSLTQSFQSPAEARAAQSPLPPCPPEGRRHYCFGMRANNEGVYLGEHSNNRAHGRGSWSFSGNVYHGEFRDGQFHGQGEYTFSDGQKHVGEFRFGRFPMPPVVLAQTSILSSPQEVKPTSHYCQRVKSLSQRLSEDLAWTLRVSISSLQVIRSEPGGIGGGCEVTIDSLRGPVRCDTSWVYSDGQSFWAHGLSAYCSRN